MNRLFFFLFLPLFVLFSINFNFAQSIPVDAFESLDAWKKITSDGVDLKISLSEGKIGKAIRIDYDFTKGSGFCGIRRSFPISFPEQYAFSFYIKGDSPSNNLEFKILDESGDNVWWSNQRRFDFPQDWKKIARKKRHFEFAWGPTTDHTLRTCAQIEIIIASAEGGKGTVYLDELTFETLPVPPDVYPKPIMSLSDSRSSADAPALLDGSLATTWFSADSKEQTVTLDLGSVHEFDGLILRWDDADFATDFTVSASNDGILFDDVYHAKRTFGGSSYISLPEQNARYVTLTLNASAGSRFGISEIEIKEPGFAGTPNAFFLNVASEFPRGFFPKYLLKEKSYWTITGVNSDTKETLINEEGMIEADKSSFSVEPFLRIDGSFITWNDVSTEQRLYEEYLPIPIVDWKAGDISLSTKVFADGASDSSYLNITYTIKNNGQKSHNVTFFPTLRPFQVNPYYQFLNTSGGVANIRSIKMTDGAVIVNGNKSVIPLLKPDRFGTLSFDDGPVTAILSKGLFPAEQSVTDAAGYASAVFEYAMTLLPGQEKHFYFVLPFHSAKTTPPFTVEAGKLDQQMEDKLQRTAEFWRSKLNHVTMTLPPSANHLVNVVRSTLAYILINRDHAGIQPGSRSYERSWMRDGSLTSSALLKMGIVPEVKEFVKWYASYQYPDGKIPCVVDKRGPDPVPENDSHGEFIFMVNQYFNFTKDTTLLRDMYPHVKNTVAYMNSLIAQRKTERYLDESDTLRPYFGLMPESISHEGYSAKPMHSYWDNFFTMKGFKDAVTIAEVLGEKTDAERFIQSRDSFHVNLYASLTKAIERKNISYIPGCVELGDFDATSTTIALYPCNELQNLPQPFAKNTFDRYYDFFTKRKSPNSKWVNYTPYEVRIIGSYIYLGEKKRAHDLVDFFFADQRPKGWNHWAEVVWHDPKFPGFIGDMPHTWVGSDFVNAVRAMFVYEDELKQRLVIGAGLKQDWIDFPDGIAIEHLPTYYGELSYSIQSKVNTYTVTISGSCELPKGGIFISPLREGERPASVTVNGKTISTFGTNGIEIFEFPSDIVITY